MLLLGAAEEQRIVDQLLHAGVEMELFFRALEFAKGRIREGEMRRVIDKAILVRGGSPHTVIEAHPQVYERMK